MKSEKVVKICTLFLDCLPYWGWEDLAGKLEADVVGGRDVEAAQQSGDQSEVGQVLGQCQVRVR